MAIICNCLYFQPIGIYASGLSHQTPTPLWGYHCKPRNKAVTPKPLQCIPGPYRSTPCLFRQYAWENYLKSKKISPWLYFVTLLILQDFFKSKNSKCAESFHYSHQQVPLKDKPANATVVIAGYFSLEADGTNVHREIGRRKALVPTPKCIVIVILELFQIATGAW